MGSLGNCVNHYLIAQTSNYLIKEAVAWDNDNHITFNVPFDDLKPTIHLGKRERWFSKLTLECNLDIFLPRIVDLALHSSDRQTKITACESLQSIMLYMIGKSANNRSSAAVCLPTDSSFESTDLLLLRLPMTNSTNIFFLPYSNFPVIQIP